MKFKELAYKSTGYVFEFLGAAYVVYGMGTGNKQMTAEGLVGIYAGMIINQRTKHVTDKMNSLSQRISELEQKVDQDRTE